MHTSICARSSRMTMTTSGWWDVKKWVLSCGSDAEVLEPKEMREEIKAELQKSMAFYMLA